MTNEMRKLMEAIQGVENDFDKSVEVLGEDHNDMEDIINELSDIKEQIKGLAYDAGSLVDGTDERDSARSYWIGHILGALDSESEYGSGSMVTMQDTIDALAEDAGSFEDDDDDEMPNHPEYR